MDGNGEKYIIVIGGVIVNYALISRAHCECKCEGINGWMDFGLGKQWIFFDGCGWILIKDMEANF
jgi:hypothetical protein